MFPVLAVGTTTYYYGNELISKQLPQVKQESAKNSTETALAIQRQLSLLLMGTGMTAVLAGAIAAFVAHRAIRPVVNAAAISTNIMNGLRPESEQNYTLIANKGEFEILETNINSIKQVLAGLLSENQAEAEYSQQLIKITRRIRESFNEEDILKSTVAEIRQIAMQVGFALDHARLLQRIDAEGMRTQLLVDITRQIRASLHEEDVLKNTVEEVRKALSTDRVIVYSFDSDWYGTIVAESVVPGFPKALRAKIKDPCFAEGYVEKYQAGRVQAINNIYEANLTNCHINQLEPFAVKANLVAPILKDEQLFGLLIAHQCSEPRNWQQSEIDLFTQVAIQVGFALDHARLLGQVEQAYQAAEVAFEQQRQQKEALQHQVSELFRNSEIPVQTFSKEVINQRSAVTSAYNQIQELVDSALQILASAQQTQLQEQQLSQVVQDGHEFVNQILGSICAIRETVVEVGEKVKCLDQPSQKLLEMVDLTSRIADQIKLDAMHTVLEISRSGEAGQKFAAIAEKVLSLVQHLDVNFAEIKPLVTEIRTQSNEVMVAMESGAEQLLNGTKLVEVTQHKLDQILTVSTQMKTLVTELAQAAAVQAQLSNSTNQSILKIASITSQTSEQAVAVAESLAKLKTLMHDDCVTNNL